MRTLIANTFTRWWVYQLKINDCDPGLYMLQYLMVRFELNTEQRYWLCWIYANTYHVPTAWVIFNEFPDFEHVCLERLTAFQLKYKAQLPYQNDQKWLRGRLPETFAAYREACPMGQEFMWDCANNNFDAAWAMILSSDFPKFGRYTAWFYLQALNECCGHTFTPDHMFLGDPSSEQPRKGLLWAIERDENRHHIWSNGELDIMAGCIQQQASELTAGLDLPVHADYFSMETALCSFSKLHRGGSKGRYLGYYLDRAAEDIQKTSQCGWTGINWKSLWDSRSEILLPEFNHPGVRHEEMSVFPNTGAFCSDLDTLDRLINWFDSLPYFSAPSTDE